jgi:hypothetical protein
MRGSGLRVSGAECQDAEQMPGSEMGRVAREDLAAGRFGLGEASGRLLGVGALEQPLERGGSAVRPFLRQLLRFHAVILSRGRCGN